jgi:hypothetical protein
MYTHTSTMLFSCCGILTVLIQGHSLTKVNYAQWNKAWMLQQEMTVNDILKIKCYVAL